MSKTKSKKKPPKPSASKVKGRIEEHLSSPDWNWRHQVNEDDPVDVAAVTKLRAERDLAASWTERAAASIGLSLPIGNGVGGPWQRQAVVGPNGKLGIVDIASGMIAWTDTDVPPLVRQFALKLERAESPHEAGETGGMGSAVEQIALVYGMRDARQTSESPTPHVVWVEWGLQTCYGHCGEEPTDNNCRQEWARLVVGGADLRETTSPQWEKAIEGVRADVMASWLRLPADKPDWHRRTKTVGLDRRTRPDHLVGNVHLEVRGVGSARRERIAKLRAEWSAWTQNEVARRAAEAIRDFCLGAGLCVPPCASLSKFILSDWDLRLARAQRHLLAFAAPPDPLTREERRAVRERADELLARDPAEAGLSLRDPWGRPGYPSGANHLSYLLPKGCPHDADILDEPGVRAWLAAVHKAASEEERRLDLPRGGGGVTKEEIERLVASGYDVEVLEHGRICATRRT